uniref:Reverse transcriptase Ty1/copia-type domain-containing protein n=1 Tax=Tanacetum cinerariifolium TaxID=118510 RepID=A0A6L2JC02_TANCI|nr:hypothetical protein [Tanacetum cinerariifolium]
MSTLSQFALACNSIVLKEVLAVMFENDNKHDVNLVIDRHTKLNDLGISILQRAELILDVEKQGYSAEVFETVKVLKDLQETDNAKASQHYSYAYPSPPQSNHSSVPSSYPYQSLMNHQTSSIPQIAYQSPQVTTQPMTESPLMDLGFAVLVFFPRDYPIACLNKAMSFLTAVASLRFPSTINKLRTSSKLRNQAAIQDGRVTVQQVQGRQGQSYSSTGYKSNGENNASGLEMTEDLDTYDSDCDDISNTQAVLMANISIYGSNVISEEKITLKEQVDSLEQNLSKQINKKECLLQTFIVFKSESKEKEDKYLEKEIDLEKKIKELDNILFKVAPKELSKISLVNKSLKKLKLYLAKFENVVKIRTTPNARTEEFFEKNDLKAQLQDKDSTIYKLKGMIKSMREKSKEENVEYDYGEIETKNVELENSTRVHTKEYGDSLIDKLNLKSSKNEDLKPQIEDKVFVITSLKTDLRRIKGKEIIDIAAHKPSANTIVPVETQKPELKVYSRKPKNVKNVGSSKKDKIVKSKNANHSEPNHTWGSNASDIPSSFSLVMTGFPDCSLDTKPDLSFFHVFGALCYPTNDNDDLGKLDAKVDIDIFVDYAPVKKASGHGLQCMTPATSSSGLVPNTISQQPCIPPNRDDWNHLFQPMFDEYFTPPAIVVPLIQEAVAPRAVDLADSLVSTSIDQDAPSSSTISTQEQEQSLNISQGFEESPKIPTFRDDPLPESLNEDSTSQGSSSNVRQPTLHLNTLVDRLRVLKNKARLVAQGFRQEVGINFKESFSPYNPSHVYKLKKALYGLKQVPRAWYNMLSSFLISQHVSKGAVDPTLFTRQAGNDLLLVQIYVDDIIFSSTNTAMCNEFANKIATKFKMSVMGQMSFFLGLKISQSPEGIFINQSNYAYEIVKKNGMLTSDFVDPPMVEKSKLDEDLQGTPIDATLYRDMIGSLMYLTSSRPDLIYAVYFCARYQAKPIKKHLNAVKWIFQYLKEPLTWVSGTRRIPVTLDTRRSTSGSAQFLAGLQRSKKCTAISSTKAEYVALSGCYAQILWMRSQITDYGIQFNKIPLYCDNKRQVFEDLPLEQGILFFIRDLGHTRDITYLTDVNADYLHQPWRAFSFAINKFLSDLLFQIEYKDAKKTNKMSYHRFTKIIIDYFMLKDPSILRRNKKFWHTARDDTLFTSRRCISRHEDTQVYGTILPTELINQAMFESKSYQTYYSFDFREKAPKPKYIQKKADSDTSPKKKPIQATKGTRLKSKSKVAKPDKKKQPAKKTKAKGLAILSEVALTKAEQIKLATKRSKKYFHISHESGTSNGVDTQSKVLDEQQQENSGTDEGTGTKLGVLDVPPYESASDKESWGDSEDKDDNDDDGESDDHDDDKDDEEKLDDEETMDDEEDDDVIKEVYDDVNVNLGNDDSEMTDVDQGASEQKNVSQKSGFEQEKEDAHVTLTPVLGTQKADESVQSSYVSSDFTSKLLNLENPSLADNKISSLTKTPVPHTTSFPEFTSGFTTTTPLPPSVSSLESKIAELKQTNQFAVAVSLISGIVDKYLASKMKEAVSVPVQLQTNKLKEEAQAENQEFLNQMAYAITSSLSEFKLKKILINKIEANKLINRSDNPKNLYNTLVESYNFEKDIITSNGDVVLLKKGQDDQDKDEKPSAGSDRETKRRKSGNDAESSKDLRSKEKKSSSISKDASHHKYSGKSTHAEEPSHTVEDSGMQQDQEFIMVDFRPPQTWISQVALAEEPPTSFYEFNDTSFDFSAFVMDRLQILNVTQEILVGLAFNLLKGTCKSITELEYHLEECSKATTGRDLSRRYSTSVTKTKAATYKLKCIEDLVPELWSPVLLKYDQHAYLGTSHWGPKPQRFYGYASNLTSSKDVYSRRRIITVTRLKIMKKYDYGHLEEIEVRRDDQQLYMFKEGDFKRLRLQDIKDMLLLLIQQKLTNLTIDEQYDLNVALPARRGRVIFIAACSYSTDIHKDIMKAQKQVFVDDDYYYMPLVYNVKGRFLHFERLEFSLITRLHFGSYSFRKFKSRDVTFVSRVLPHKLGLKVSSLDLLGLTEDEELFGKLVDDDTVRVCLLLALEVIFIRKKLVDEVPDTLMRLVENLVVWNDFRWGSLIWWNRDPEIIPRGLAWSRKQLFKRSDYSLLFGKVILDLTPMISEQQNFWYMAFRKFYMSYIPRSPPTTYTDLFDDYMKKLASSHKRGKIDSRDLPIIRRCDTTSVEEIRLKDGVIAKLNSRVIGRERKGVSLTKFCVNGPAMIDLDSDEDLVKGYLIQEESRLKQEGEERCRLEEHKMMKALFLKTLQEEVQRRDEKEKLIKLATGKEHKDLVHFQLIIGETHLLWLKRRPLKTLKDQYMNLFLKDVKPWVEDLSRYNRATDRVHLTDAFDIHLGRQGYPMTLIRPWLVVILSSFSFKIRSPCGMLMALCTKFHGVMLKRIIVIVPTPYSSRLLGLSMDEEPIIKAKIPDVMVQAKLFDQKGIDHKRYTISFTANAVNVPKQGRVFGDCGDVVLRTSYRPYSYGKNTMCVLVQRNRISSSRPSTPPTLYTRPSTRPSYYAGTSRSAMNVRKAECSNCKFLAEKIKTLEAKIKILKGTLEMERHPKNHTIKSAAILHELYNDMENLVKMDDRNITIKEYIRLEEEKSCRRGKVYNWETVKYGKIWDNKDIHDLGSVGAEFPAIVFNDTLTYETTLLYEPTPTVSYFDDLDFFKDFENEFSAIVYNDAQTSKSNLLAEPILCTQHINEFDLKEETSLSKYNEEEQNILNFNDLFPFNVIYPNDSKSDKENDDDKVDIEHSSGDLSVKPLPDVTNMNVGAYA